MGSGSEKSIRRADYDKGAVESLAKLPHGIAALASILFD